MFRASHDTATKLTTLTFDSNQRRLLTGANSGSLRMWNFNSGNLLREYEHEIEDLEITTALFISDEKRGYDRILAAGWNSQIFIWEDEDSDKLSYFIIYKLFLVSVEYDLLVTGDYEGKIIVWKLSTGTKKMALYHRAERYETSVDRLLWLNTTNESKEEMLLLLSAGGDGIIRVWSVLTVQPRLLVTLEGAHGRLGEVSALIAGHGSVIIGDSYGNIRVLDVSNGVDLTSRISTKESFKQLAHWKAHEDGVSGLDFLEMETETQMIISCSKDTNVCLWTATGRLVGTFGCDTWKLDDPRTWRDHDGPLDRPVEDCMDDIFQEVSLQHMSLSS
eukprot:g1372.t1